MKNIRVGYFQSGYPVERNMLRYKPSKIKFIKLNKNFMGGEAVDRYLNNLIFVACRKG